MPYLLDTPCEQGQPEVAYQLFFQTQCSFWLYEVEEDATNFGETWDAVLLDGAIMLISFNHYGFVCVGD